MKNKSLKNLYSCVVQPVSSLRTHQQIFGIYIKYKFFKNKFLNYNSVC